MPLRGTTGLQKTNSQASCKALQARHSEEQRQDAPEVFSHSAQPSLPECLRSIKRIPGKDLLLAIRTLASIESSDTNVILRKTNWSLSVQASHFTGERNEEVAHLACGHELGRWNQAWCSSYHGQLLLMSFRSCYNIGLISVYGIKVFVTSLKGI